MAPKGAGGYICICHVCVQNGAGLVKNGANISSFGTRRGPYGHTLKQGARTVSRGSFFGPVLEPNSSFGHQFRLAGAPFAIFWLPFGVHVDGLLCFFGDFLVTC